jgi:hypothetical protein
VPIGEQGVKTAIGMDFPNRNKELVQEFLSVNRGECRPGKTDHQDRPETVINFRAFVPSALARKMSDPLANASCRPSETELAQWGQYPKDGGAARRQRQYPCLCSGLRTEVISAKSCE